MPPIQSINVTRSAGAAVPDPDNIPIVNNHNVDVDMDADWAALDAAQAV